MQKIYNKEIVREKIASAFCLLIFRSIIRILQLKYKFFLTFEFDKRVSKYFCFIHIFYIIYTLYLTYYLKLCRLRTKKGDIAGTAIYDCAGSGVSGEMSPGKAFLCNGTDL